MSIYNNTSKLVQIYQNRDGEKFLKDFLREQLEELNCNCSEVVWNLSSQPLRKIDLPMCESIQPHGFYECFTLEKAILPKCKGLYEGTFENCVNLNKVQLNNCEFIEDMAFAGCYSLSSLDLPVCGSIGLTALIMCSRLSEIYLRKNSICQLAGIAAFAGTPFGGESQYFSGTPKIYVPENLVEDYKTATNWSYYSSYFTPIQ